MKFKQQDLSKHKPRAIKLVTTVAIILFAIMLLTTVIVVRWAVSGQDVLVVKNAPVPVRTIREHPEADGVVILKVDYCKRVKATGEIRTSFVGVSREVFLPKAKDEQPAQCNGGGPEPVEVPILIPRDLTVGHYHIHFRVVYKVNPIKEVIEEFDSQTFEIVGHQEHKQVEGVPAR